MPADAYLTPGPQDEAWARQHTKFIDLVVRHLLAEGVWPDVRMLQRDLSNLEPGIEVVALARDMPSELGSFDPDTCKLALNGYGLTFSKADFLGRM